MHISAVILAAGEGSRFGAVKPLAVAKEHTLLQQTVMAVESSGVHSVNVVLGAYEQQIRDAEQWLHNYTVVSNEVWQAGLSSSIRCGLRALSQDITHVLICVIDQVGLSDADYRQLVQQASNTPEKIIASVYADSFGVPAIFPRHYFSELMSLTGDVGAKKIIKKHQNQVAFISVPAALTDTDTQLQLQQWIANQ